MKSDKHVFKAELGASLVEYVILVALISVACIFAVQTLGQEIANNINESTDKIAGAGTQN